MSVTHPQSQISKIDIPSFVRVWNTSSNSDQFMERFRPHISLKYASYLASSCRLAGYEMRGAPQAKTRNFDLQDFIACWNSSNTVAEVQKKLKQRYKKTSLPGIAYRLRVAGIHLKTLKSSYSRRKVSHKRRLTMARPTQPVQVVQPVAEPEQPIDFTPSAKLSKYHKLVGPAGQQVYVDIYDLIIAYEVNCPARQHAIKKLFAAGQRGNKSELLDLEEALWSIQRAIDLLKTQQSGQSSATVSSDGSVTTPS